MRILLVNKFHYLKGGSEKYYFELGKLLKEHGHQIAYFSMYDEKNIKTGDKEFFAEQFDLNKGNRLKALDVIYSKENYKKMVEAIEDFKPEIIHLNNFQRQLSASVTKAAKDKKIPLVYTAHDVQAICPAITMLDNNKEICEDCLGGKYFNCIKKKCNKGSKLKSIIGALEGRYYRNKKIYTNQIDYIITPSEFYKKKLIEDGIPEKKLEAIHNFINSDDYNLPLEDGGYALYFGRLSKEKGILNLIDAFSKLDKGTLYIAGTGPEEDNIKRIICDNKLDKKIKMLGFLEQKEMKEIIRKCKFVVIPSVWYENCPYSILETQAIGKAIIGANIGGIPELVENNKNGYLYNYNDINDLANKMQMLFNDNKLVENFSNSAKIHAHDNYNKEEYYNKLIQIYNKCCKRS